MTACLHVTLELQGVECVGVEPLCLAVVNHAARVVVRRHERETPGERQAFEVTTVCTVFVSKLWIRIYHRVHDVEKVRHARKRVWQLHSPAIC